MMLLVLFVRFLSSLSRRLEPYYLRWTQLPRSSLALGLALDLPRSKSELLLENALLRQPLIILQRQAKKPHFNHRVRLFLLLLASRLPHWKQLLLILKPDPLLRGHRQGFRLSWRLKTRTRRGRPHLSPDLVALIQRIAAENPHWGAKRIHGELLKLGLPGCPGHHSNLLASRPASSVAFPGLEHVYQESCEGRVACDLLSVVDLFFRSIYVFCVIELNSHRVLHYGTTRQPTDLWVAQQLREATLYSQAPRFLVQANDREFGSAFASVVRGSGRAVLLIPYWAPRANAVCERFLGSVQRERLDHILILSEGHWYRVVKEYVEFFNSARPHQGIEQRIPEPLVSKVEVKRERKIFAFPVLHGFHHGYRRVA